MHKSQDDRTISFMVGSETGAGSEAMRSSAKRPGSGSGYDAMTTHIEREVTEAEVDLLELAK